MEVAELKRLRFSLGGHKCTISGMSRPYTSEGQRRWDVLDRTQEMQYRGGLDMYG